MIQAKKTFILAAALMLTAQMANAQKKHWTLKECVDYALKNNISVQSSELNIRDAQWQYKGARGNFLPGASASANYNFNSGLTQDITTNALLDQRVQNTSLGVSVGVDLFTGLQNLNQLRRAEVNMLASRYQLEDMKDNISLNVANAFLQILFNQESLKVLRLQRDVTLEEIKRTSQLIESGTLPPGDILEIEASAASQEQQIVNAENAIRISKIALSQLLQLKDYEDFEIASESYDIPDAQIINNSPDEIYSKALTTINNIKISEANVDIAEKNMELSKAGYYPSLSAFYSFNTRAINKLEIEGNTANLDPVTRQFQNNRGQVFGLQLNVPLFSRFQNDVSQQRSRLNLEQARLNLEQTKIDLESAVHQAYNDALGALKAYHAAEKTKVARQEAFKYAEERHNVGVIHSFEYQQTKQLLETAESDVVRTKYDYIFKLKILEFYFGIPLASE